MESFKAIQIVIGQEVLMIPKPLMVMFFHLTVEFSLGSQRSRRLWLNLQQRLNISQQQQLQTKLFGSEKS
jgi:hypothetical protein